MKALCFDRFGPADVLEYRDLPDPRPGPGELLVRTRAIGLNFADVYRRQGNYHLQGDPPWILGYEAAGFVEALGEGVSGFAAGDRVGFADVPFANAELVVVPEEQAIPLPESISFETAAAILLQGLTAHYLTQDSHSILFGETVLVHAAAGGVGLLLTRIATALGGRVLALTSSSAKGEAARAAGAESVALYSEDWVAAARRFSGGRGVDVAYDSVGSTLEDSFRATRTGGHVVFYGMAGGDPKPVNPRMLMDTSKTLTGGDLWNVLTTAQERRSRAHQLFDWMEAGQLALSPPTRFPLAQGADAHRLLESRRSTGKILLIP
ncbi:MAG: quinone oxidoreductase [Thermoanaerobaculia bacterium]